MIVILALVEEFVFPVRVVEVVLEIDPLTLTPLIFLEPETEIEALELPSLLLLALPEMDMFLLI